MPTDFIAVPDWGSWENQGGGVAVADLTGDGRPDLLVLQVDSPEGANRGLYGWAVGGRGQRGHRATS